MPILPTDTRLVLMKDDEEHVRGALGAERSTILYLAASETERRSIYSVLAADEKIQGLLQRSDFPLRPGDGGPAFCTSYKGTIYDRLGHHDGIEPIVHVRTQRDDNLVELIEEFRLLYDLYYGPNRELFQWTEDGEKEVVGTVGPDKVEINTRLLRQFLAVKQKNLVICFHHRRGFNFNMSEVAASDHSREYQDDNTYVNFWLTDMVDGLADEKEKTVACFAGKKVIRPLPIEQCGIPPYHQYSDGPFESFIVGQDEDGKDILHACDPRVLSDYAGGNPTAPSFLTQICFRRDVLTHYFNQTGKYSVGDGTVTCAGFWILSVDNHGKDHVFVFLGDLSMLPYTEQLHWKRFNIPIAGAMSETARARSFYGEFADATGLDLVFKNRLADLELSWPRMFGWHLFHPLTKEDAHFLESLHIPAVSDQGQFDRQILNLAKVLVDRINGSRLADECATKPENPGSINALERYLQERQLPELKETISVLRDIQSLRSSGAVHLKGEEYVKLAAKLGLTSDNLIEAFRSLLQRSISFMTAIESGALALFTQRSH